VLDGPNQERAGQKRRVTIRTAAVDGMLGVTEAAGIKNPERPYKVENIVSVDKYLSFFIRMILIFGAGFLAPLILVALNFAGILPGRKLLSWWRWIIFITCLFAAVATPTGDPINLLLLAVPVLLLLAIAVAICLLNDRRRDRRRGRSGDAEIDELDDDTISPLPPSSPVD
jgi:sec-independent protein translocase protein TatC